MQQEIIRESEIKLLDAIIEKYDPNKIFLVHGKNSYKNSGAELFIANKFNNQLSSFSDFDVNPNSIDLQKGIELFNKGNYELIIAIGGGSVIDMAKLISGMATQPTEVENLIKGDIDFDNSNIDLMAIPTTAGTGAEATHFAVAYINKQKYSVSNDSILPKYVFLSPRFLISTSPYLIAVTGVDAMAQAMESQWSINATAESEKYSLEAFNIIWNNLEAAVIDNNEKAKAKMLEASFIAGKAINITKTTAPHALSYFFTSYYGIAHGHAVGLSLAFFLKFNSEVTDVDCTLNNGANIVKKRIIKLLTIMNADENTAFDILNDFLKKIGLELNINKLIGNIDTKLMLRSINFERLNNNPRRVSNDTIKDFLNTNN